MINFVIINRRNQPWWVLIVCSLAFALVSLDHSAIPLALPQMQLQFNASNTSLAWIINAYLLTLALFTMLGGKLGDIFGPTKIYFAGVILFLIASIICAFSYSMLQIVIGRLIQGIGSAFIIPITAAILIETFPNQARGRAIGSFVAFATTFTALGPILGGFITEFASWRWVFGLNVPIAAICLILAGKTLPADNIEKTTKSFDWFGLIFLNFSITPIIIALMEGSNLGWDSFSESILIALGLINFIFFFFIEKNASNPLINFQMFSKINFNTSCIIMFIMKFALITTVFWSIYLQNVLLYTPAMAGILLLPVMAPSLFMAPASGLLRDKFGPRLPVLAGTFATMVAAIWIGFVARSENYTLLFPAFLLFGCGIYFTSPVLVTTAISAITKTQRASASGLASFIRQIGNLAGLTIASAIIINMTQYYLVHSTRNLVHNKLNTILAGQTHMHEALITFQPELANRIYYASLNAYVNSFRIAMYVTAAIIFIALLLSLRLPKTIEE